jgi:hypothetical protein
MNWLNPLSWFSRRGTVEVLTPKKPRIASWDAYAGDFPAILSKTKTDPNADDNVRVPLVADIADVSVNHELGAEGPTMTVEGGGVAQAFLDDFLKRSRFQVAVRKAAYHGAFTGHRFLKLIVTDGRPDRVQVVPSDAVGITTDPRDADRVTEFVISWKDGEDEKRERIERKAAGIGWTIYQEVRRKGQGVWTLDGDAASPITDWPFDSPPLYDCQNLTDPNRYWGRADLTQAAIRQNHSINILYSLASRMLRVHASPKTAVTGMELPRRGVGKSSLSHDGEGTVPDGAGMVWETDGVVILPEGASVEQLQFSADGVNAILGIIDSLEQKLRDTTRTPMVASGKLPKTSGLLGTDLSILFRPLVEKTGEKRTHMSGLLERLCEDILTYAGYPNRVVKTVWPDTMPRNEKEEREVAEIDLRLGLASKQTISRKLGYDYDEERREIEAEGGADTPAEPVAAP